MQLGQAPRLHCVWEGVGSAPGWRVVGANRGTARTSVSVSKLAYWLVSGTVIVWDGRAARHRTAMPAGGAGDGSALYGFFMAAGK